MPRSLIAALSALAAIALLAPPAVRAEGKYAKRQKARGEVTDTAAKLDRFAFINDDWKEPERLVLVVDTWVARGPHDARFLPLVVALSYEGHGEPFPVTPGRFLLACSAWTEPLPALTHAQLVEAASGASPLLPDLRLLERRTPLAFDTPEAEYLDAHFYTNPALPHLVYDTFDLEEERWFMTLMYFRVPEDFDRWDELMELRYVPAPGGPPAASCAFRVPRDPALHQAAMRRARKAAEKENRDAR